jgi:hypothetical protein
MAPTASKKGTQSKAGSTKVDRRSTSRHSTPVSALTETSPPTPRTATPSSAAASASSMPRETAYLQTSTAALICTEPSIETLIEKSNASVAKPGDPPGARELHILHDKIRDTVNRFMFKRGEVCDRSMRQLVQKRKERAVAEQEYEATRAEEERVKIKREEDERRKERKNPGKKRSHDEMEIDEESQEKKEQKENLPSVGAHGVARQDGVGVNQGGCLLFHSLELHAPWVLPLAHCACFSPSHMALRSYHMLTSHVTRQARKLLHHLLCCLERLYRISWTPPTLPPTQICHAMTLRLPRHSTSEYSAKTQPQPKTQ